MGTGMISEIVSIEGANTISSFVVIAIDTSTSSLVVKSAIVEMKVERLLPLLNCIDLLSPTTC